MTHTKVTIEEIKQVLFQCYGKDEPFHQVVSVILTHELRRRERAGRKPQPNLPSLKERNALAAKRKRKKKSLKQGNKKQRIERKTMKVIKNIEDCGKPFPKGRFNGL